MIEKVNPCHPDKVADRIAGAIVDLAYSVEDDPKIAVEVLIGHGVCHAIIETTASVDPKAIEAAIVRIAGEVRADVQIVPQDAHLSENQKRGARCGDNGIFKGVPLTDEQQSLSRYAHEVFDRYPCDGKYILDGDRLIICQSNAPTSALRAMFPTAEINPLGDWTGGTDVDTGATNRKLGSDMADSVTGGGLAPQVRQVARIELGQLGQLAQQLAFEHAVGQRRPQWACVAGHVGAALGGGQVAAFASRFHQKPAQRRRLLDMARKRVRTVLADETVRVMLGG